MKLRILAIVLLAFFTLGFRTFSGGNLWMISKDDPVLYLRFCEDMVPQENDVDSNDSLYGSTITHNTMVDSIMSDYNNISGAYVVLADSKRAPGFNSTVYQYRIIDICFAEQQSTVEGHAAVKFDSEYEHFTGCEIKVGKKILTKAKRLLRTLTHEIGHCLALDHDFDTRHSLMSYFSTAYRLQSDDKAGVVHLYPENSEDVAEHATLGLSCSAR